MKKAIMIGIITAFILSISLTASASRRSYIDHVLDEWIELAVDEDLEVVDYDIDSLDEDYSIISYTLDLPRGDYWIVAQGGENITDLDLAAYYEDEYEDDEDPFVADNFDDNYPILEFSLRGYETIVVEVIAWEFERGEDEGYYCILFCEED